MDSFVGVLLGECEGEQENWGVNCEGRGVEGKGKEVRGRDRDNPMRMSMPVIGEKEERSEGHSLAIRQMHLMRRKT